ncbi:DUF1570 domain-containing protein [Montanilutibacter psychrotolerans]|uniref:DUF1570 domain-containing protein n=1 Tax=Montanilutibacter psychrotolerans TaxID=1327343 RepID=A0A3M8SL81_9GAMM|nr:DUF1570 domain-containing protein [Lysobacter psychrotolerans]RNF82071.1 DUF1570 domain-containing protein [Lysobacter psychrotolerans]
MPSKTTVSLILLAAVAAVVGYHVWPNPPSQGADTGIRPPGSAAPPEPTRGASAHPLPATIVETAHYTIASTATPERTERVAKAAESLYDAYVAFFGDSLNARGNSPRLQLVLYRDRKQFKAHNRSSPWAEAYYLPPASHAYFDDSRPNPYHWMVHEATHQLNREVANLSQAPWINEGVATYFNASRIQDGKLQPGIVDTNTYPIWWLSTMKLSGNREEDIRAGRIIPLRKLIASGRVDIGGNVNLHYIEFWSLTHFLLHHDNGRFAGKYRELMKTAGTLDDAERLLGPIEQLESPWYEHLRQQIGQLTDGPQDDASDVRWVSPS